MGSLTFSLGLTISLRFYHRYIFVTVVIYVSCLAGKVCTRHAIVRLSTGVEVDARCLNNSVLSLRAGQWNPTGTSLITPR